MGREGGGEGYFPAGGPAPGLPTARWSPTIGLQVHLVLVLVFAQLDLLGVGLLGQLCQLLAGCVAPGVGGATLLQQGASRQPPRASPSPEELAPLPAQVLSSPHKQDLALGPRGLVPLGLSRQLLGPLLQQLHVIHAALPGGQVGHCGDGVGVGFRHWAVLRHDTHPKVPKDSQWR